MRKKRTLSPQGNEQITQGVFTLSRYTCAETFPLEGSPVLLFCLYGEAQLRFTRYRFTLTPGSLAAVAADAQVECDCTPQTGLLAYRPPLKTIPPMQWDRTFVPSLTATAVEPRFREWILRTAQRLEQGKIGPHVHCDLALLLREYSGGMIPYPFACSPDCSAWRFCMEKFPDILRQHEKTGVAPSAAPDKTIGLS